MEKEKQAFEQWIVLPLSQEENDFTEYFDDSCDTQALSFYGGYHSRDEEIAALKAEHRKAIAQTWKESKTLIERLTVEIERKDEVLRHIQSFCGDEMIGETDILERIENLNLPEIPDSLQVLSEEE